MNVTHAAGEQAMATVRNAFRGGLAALLATVPAASNAVTAPIIQTPEQITWQACPPAAPPGAQCAFLAGDRNQPGLFSYRIKLPDNYQMFPHVHLSDEQVIVLQGEYHAGFGDHVDRERAHVLTPGSFMLIPAGMPHYAWSKGETILQVYALGPWALKR
jgi:mannose-6-phosphate isomerase-like protein (cupin superfamily)